MIDINSLENSCGTTVCAYRGKGVCSSKQGDFCPMYTAYKPEFFVEKEFQACVPPCSMKAVHPVFLKVLDEIRRKAGIPIVLTCVFRSRQYDLERGRSGKGAHTYGLAADIRCCKPANRWKIIEAARQVGVTRIGVAPTYIHIDIGENTGLAADVFWTYDSKGNAV